MECPLLATRCGANEPSSMPTTEAARPIRLAGTRASAARLAAPIQQPMPRMMDSKAPCVVARFQ